MDRYLLILFLMLLAGAVCLCAIRFCRRFPDRFNNWLDGNRPTAPRIERGEPTEEWEANDMRRHV